MKLKGKCYRHLLSETEGEVLQTVTHETEGEVTQTRGQELCESRGGRPGNKPTVSVDVKQRSTNRRSLWPVCSMAEQSPVALLRFAADGRQVQGPDSVAATV